MSWQRNWLPHLPHVVLTGPSLLYSTLSLSLSLSHLVSNSTQTPNPLCDFFHETDALLSCSPDDGTLLAVLANLDFSIPPVKLRPPEVIDFFSTFDLTLFTSPPGPGTNSTLPWPESVRLQDWSTPLRLPFSCWLSCTVPPEPCPTCLSSFSSTYPPRLTQSTTESSSPLWLNLALLTDLS